MDKDTEAESDCMSIVSNTTRGSEDFNSPRNQNGLKMLQDRSKEEDSQPSPVIGYAGEIILRDKQTALEEEDSSQQTQAPVDDDAMSSVSESLLSNHNLYRASQVVKQPRDHREKSKTKGENFDEIQLKGGKSEVDTSELYGCKTRLKKIKEQLESSPEMQGQAILTKLGSTQGTVLQALLSSQKDVLPTDCKECVKTIKNILSKIRQGHDTKRQELGRAVKLKGQSKERKQKVRKELVSLSTLQKILLDLFQKQQEIHKLMKSFAPLSNEPLRSSGNESLRSESLSRSSSPSRSMPPERSRTKTPPRSKTTTKSRSPVGSRSPSRTCGSTDSSQTSTITTQKEKSREELKKQWEEEKRIEWENIVGVSSKRDLKMPETDKLSSTTNNHKTDGGTMGVPVSLTKPTDNCDVILSSNGTLKRNTCGTSTDNDKAVPSPVIYVISNSAGKTRLPSDPSAEDVNPLGRGLSKTLPQELTIVKTIPNSMPFNKAVTTADTQMARRFQNHDNTASTSGKLDNHAVGTSTVYQEATTQVSVRPIKTLADQGKRSSSEVRGHSQHSSQQQILQLTQPVRKQQNLAPKRHSQMTYPVENDKHFGVNSILHTVSVGSKQTLSYFSNPKNNPAQKGSAGNFQSIHPTSDVPNATALNTLAASRPSLLAHVSRPAPTHDTPVPRPGVPAGTWPDGKASQTQCVLTFPARMKTHEDSKPKSASLVELVEKGVVQAGQGNLTLPIKGVLYRGSVTPDGRIHTPAGHFKTPTGWVSKMSGVKVKKQAAYDKVLYNGVALSRLQTAFPHSSPPPEGIKSRSAGNEAKVVDPDWHREPTSSILVNPPGLLTQAHPASSKRVDDSVNWAEFLSACKIRLVSDHELLTSEQFLPATFWAEDFSRCQLSEELWSSLEKW